MCESIGESEDVNLFPAEKHNRTKFVREIHIVGYTLWECKLLLQVIDLSITTTLRFFILP